MDISFGYTRRPKKGEVIVIYISGKITNQELLSNIIAQFQTVFPDNDVICLLSEIDETEQKRMGFTYEYDPIKIENLEEEKYDDDEEFKDSNKIRIFKKSITKRNARNKSRHRFL